MLSKIGPHTSSIPNSGSCFLTPGWLRMIIQIYEIQTPQEAEICIELGVDRIGSVMLSQDRWRVPSLKEVIGLSEGTGA